MGMTRGVRSGSSRSPAALPLLPSIEEKKSTKRSAAPDSINLQAEIYNTEMHNDVYVVGSGECGQLGMGEDVTCLLTPKIQKSLQNHKIIKISAGGMHTLALSSTGLIYSWGCNDEKALGHASEEFQVGCVNFLIESETQNKKLDELFFIDIASGDSISAAISKEGKIYAWGTFRDSKGVLGYDIKNEIREHPAIVDALSKYNFKNVFSGANHLFAITHDNVAYSWGCGEQGQLGRKILERHKTLSLKPHTVQPKRKKTEQGTPCYFIKFSCGAYHTLGLTNDGRVYSWGLNNHGQLGQGDNVDRSNAEMIEMESFDDKRVIDFGAGEHHSIALTEDGCVYTFGRGDSYQLGIKGIESSLIPMKVPNLTDIRSVSSGSNHCMAIDSRGKLYVWGYGDMGQLGTGKEEDEKIPFLLETINGEALQASAGGHHTVILVKRQ